ncbi:hypothetical protein PUMCH_004731 [Australozyma saopauloensis]|uniref:Large ribosomal subunit protein mL38 n=1 Tax=Australozyma saopauloensis TaxID=291208 RepID=A0AAX4HG08_9ASCO|nr:hypothetical protein PUMCH_004731 [[Candida] saopauloensis]
MSRPVARFLSSTSKARGVWSEYAARPSSLQLVDKTARNELFEGFSASGPSSMKSNNKHNYTSPELLDDTFKSAYEILEQDAARQYKFIEQNKDKLSAKQLEKAMVKTEQYNPEVMYNTREFADCLDRSVPVYRKFLKEKWESYGQMITMQRLEQLHVIPDTLPTLAPETEVNVKFGHNDEAEFADWVVPGTRLPAFAVSKPPTIEIQEFEPVENGTGLYTVLVVNPDVPDLSCNGYSTALHYALVNVPLDFVNNTITPLSLVEHPERVLKPYMPLLPEKNVPTQRACLWVFRQGHELKDVGVSESQFDIRAFAEENQLHAVGAHVWRQDYDRSTNSVRAEYGLEKGRVFDQIRNAEPLL